MKTIKKTSLLVLILFMGSITSCTDILDQDPITITYADVFWDSQSNADQALAGSYALFKYAMTVQASFMYWGEWPGMSFMNSQGWISDYIENDGDYVMAYRDNTRTWKHFFRAANWAFTIENYVNDMPDDLFTSVQEKNRILGEAAFVRAISYFYMTMIWGDVPVVHESIETSDQLISEEGNITRIPRSDELEVLNYTLEAVNKAIGLLEYAAPGDSRWAITANKASAEALKAKITLWYASRDKDNNEMIQESITAATSVINNSNAQLIDYVTEGEEGFKQMTNGQSKTGLFEINVSFDMDESFRVEANQDYHTGLTLNYPVFRNKNTDIGPYLDPSYYGNAFMASDPDRANDLRKELFFYMYDSPKDSFLTKYAQTDPDPNSEDAYALFSDSNILILRLADIYLLRAEAYTRLGNTSAAIEDLNLIRSKANVPDYTGATDRESLMKAIFDERAIEFVGEGQVAFDRIRMNYFEGVPWENQARLDKEGYFWPVDPSVISINPSIIQTEYWKGSTLK